MTFGRNFAKNMHYLAVFLYNFDFVDFMWHSIEVFLLLNSIALSLVYQLSVNL